MGPPPGAWGPPPPPPPKSSGSGGKVLLISALIAVAGVGGFLALSGGGDEDDEPTPSSTHEDDIGQTVTAFFDAARDGDCETAMDLVTGESVAVLGGDRAGAVEACESGAGVGMQGVELDIEGTEVTSNDGTTALVTVNGTADGDEISLPLTLLLEDDRWKVDLTSIGGRGLGQDAPPVTDVPETPDPEIAAPDTTGMSTEDVVRKFYDGLRRADCPTMVSVTSEQLWRGFTGDVFSSDPIDLEQTCADAIASGDLRTDVTSLDENFEIDDDGTGDIGVTVYRTYGTEEEFWDYLILHDENGPKIASLSQ